MVGRDDHARGFLAQPVKSPFLDHQGKSTSGLLMTSAQVDRENNRYGMIRDLISEQDEINKRRSKALHLLSVKPRWSWRTARSPTSTRRAVRSLGRTV